jgi:4-alpha-glucanotransferase
LTAVKGAPDALRSLAHAHGIQLSYTAQGGRRVRASATGMRSTLSALGVDATSRRAVESALRELADDRRRRPLEPVAVLGPTGVLSSRLAVPDTTDLRRVELTVTLEDGDVRRGRLSDVAVGRADWVENGDAQHGLTAVGLDLGHLDLPAGYHQMQIDGLGRPADALLLVPPTALDASARGFGVFAPTYALRGTADWGVGSFTELGQLADFVGAQGGDLVGTLPMFPTFLDPPVDPSPYLPISRLFTSELFIDVMAVPELSRSRAADLIDSTSWRRALAALSALPAVDYAAVMARKRQVLERCAEALFAAPSDRRAEFDRYLAAHPALASYADFRAAGEQLGSRWTAWGSEPGTLPAGAVDPTVSGYHQYVQFVAAEQLAEAAAASGDRAGLYLDLPVGVHPEGYDTWSESTSFAPATVGAPPDRLAPEGQAWGFPPLHPERIRAAGYRYVINCYRHLFSGARAIRIDHVLGLQRLFWIPRGADATDGAYVRYRSEELRAIVAIEAQRTGAVVVGEDLGTVSTDLRQAMDRDGMLHIFVYQFDASAENPFPQPTSPSVASLGSHDLARFGAFWRGLDIDDRVARGITSRAAAAPERAERRALVAAVAGRTLSAQPDKRVVDQAFRRCVGALAEGPAPYVLVDLADIEGEVVPDNRPGTGPEADNWRRRLRRPLSEIVDDPKVTELLTTVSEQRRPSNPLGAIA